MSQSRDRQRQTAMVTNSQLASNSQRSQSGARAVQPVLEAQTSDIRRFARLLRGIGFNSRALVAITEAGFEVTVTEKNKTLSATAWIPSNLFEEFKYTATDASTTTANLASEEDAACLEISLDALLQCLNIFGGAGGNIPTDLGLGGGSGGKSKKRWAGDGDAPEVFVGAGGGGGAGGRKEKMKKTAMRMTWLGSGYPLQVLLRDDAKGPTTTCDLKVFQPDAIVNNPFDADNCGLYLIMKSERFREALLDLPPTCDRITLICSGPSSADGNVMNGNTSSNQRRNNRHKNGSFSIRARGDFGETELDYPNDRDVMEKFICAEGHSMSFSYLAQHFNHLSRALNQAKQICLQIEHSGFLSIQILMPTPDGFKVGEHAGILEFKMGALEEEDELP